MAGASGTSDLASLAALHALLEEASVSGAARRLGLSTPAVSHALARLRERLSDPLLVRAGRGMVLTPRAEELRPMVREAVAAAERVFSEGAAFDPSTVAREFTVSVTDYVLAVFGRGLDAGVASSAPGLSLRFVPNAVDDAERLRSGASDLAVGIYGTLPPELKTRPIIADRLVCVVRHDHSEVGPELTLGQYVELEHVQVAPRGQPGGYVDDMLAERGLARRVTRAVPYFQAAMEIAAASNRILTVSERIARARTAELGLRVLEAPLPLEPFTLSMVWHPRYDADAAHRWLRERVFEATAASGALPDRPRRSPRRGAK